LRRSLRYSKIYWSRGFTLGFFSFFFWSIVLGGHICPDRGSSGANYRNRISSLEGGSEIYLSVPSATCALNYEGRRLQTHSSELPYFPQPVTLDRMFPRVRETTRKKVDKKRHPWVCQFVWKLRKLCVSTFELICLKTTN